MKNHALLFSIITVGMTLTSAYAAQESALAVEVAKRNGTTEAQALLAIDAVSAAIKAELSSGREVTIRNFGRFYVSQAKARVGRNPKTGAPLTIASKRYPRFVSADNFKEVLNPKTEAQQVKVPGPLPSPGALK